MKSFLFTDRHFSKVERDPRARWCGHFPKVERDPRARWCGHFSKVERDPRARWCKHFLEVERDPRARCQNNVVPLCGTDFFSIVLGETDPLSLILMCP